MLFGAVVLFMPEMKTPVTPSIFNIDIVGPVHKELMPLRTIKKKLDRPVPFKRKHPSKRILDESQPQVITGEGTSTERQKKQDAAKTLHEKNSSDRQSVILDSGESGELPEGHKDLPIKPKSFLFDEETIKKYARKKTLETEEGHKGLSFDAPELMHRGYMRMLKDKIESIWKYPAGAAHRGISGDLYITFSIQKDGKLGEVQLVRTSGYISLDEAALKALQEAAPYWPLPDDWEGNELPITGHFIYFLGGAYIL